MVATTQTVRKRTEEGGASAEAGTKAPKKSKPAGGTPGVITPLAQVSASKKRSLATGLDPAHPSTDSRSSSAPPGARTSKAADTLADLAKGAMGWWRRWTCFARRCRLCAIAQFAEARTAVAFHRRACCEALQVACSGAG